MAVPDCDRVVADNPGKCQVMRDQGGPTALALHVDGAFYVTPALRILACRGLIKN